MHIFKWNLTFLMSSFAQLFFKNNLSSKISMELVNISNFKFYAYF